MSTGLGITVLSFSTLALHNIHPFTEDTLLATVFGGMILGVGVGIVIRYGGSLDGTEILAILANSKTPFQLVKSSCSSISLFLRWQDLFLIGSKPCTPSLHTILPIK